MLLSIRPKKYSKSSSKLNNPNSHNNSSPNNALQSQNKISHLQHTLGNQSIQRMIKSGTIQAKLKVSHPNDPYEIEADRVANQVMRMADVNPKFEMSNKRNDELKISRTSTTHSNSSLETSDDISNQINNTSGGRSLDGNTKNFMESRFNHDFSGVRIHDDSRSNELARAVNAKAFTKGNDIFFGRNESVLNKSLMAHELVHVVQQKKQIHSIQRYDAHEHEKFAGAKITDKFTINGITMTYGEIIAMGGDLFSSVEEMYKVDPNELKNILKVVRKDVANPGSTNTDDWQKASKGRYGRLAKENETHFAPSNARLSPVSPLNYKNHKSEWQKHHRMALDKAKQGKKDEALIINAFGDHFLTDAFAAGHIFNKLDVMTQFQSQLTKVKKTFLNSVASKVWASTSNYISTFETSSFPYWDIDSKSRFTKLLGKINDQKPKALASLIAKIIHDKLNKSGIQAKNKKGTFWRLSGDGKLNSKSLAIGQEAVLKSRQNILNVINVTGPLNYQKYFQSVWDYVPQPTLIEKVKIQDSIKTITDPTNEETIEQVAAIIIKEIKPIMDEIVKEGHLRKKRTGPTQKELNDRANADSNLSQGGAIQRPGGSVVHR